MSEQVTEGGIHQRPRQPAPRLLGLVHVARGVQRVQAPVTLLHQIFLGAVLNIFIFSTCLGVSPAW